MQNNKFKRFLRALRDYVSAARFELIAIVAVIAVDLISKAIVAATMTQFQTVVLIPKFLNITFLVNKAAAFGSTFGLESLLGETGVLILFCIITVLAVVLFSFFLYRSRGKHKLGRLAFALIIGGALGNLYDRIFLGYVRDFVQIEYFGLTIFGAKSFAVFNLADAALTIGVILFAVYYIFIYRDKKQESLAAAQQNTLADHENIQKTELLETENTDDAQVAEKSGTSATEPGESAATAETASETTQKYDTPDEPKPDDAGDMPDEAEGDGDDKNV